MINLRGSSPFPYFVESLHGTVVTTNLDTGGTLTQVIRNNTRDQTITDNGDGKRSYCSHAACQVCSSSPAARGLDVEATAHRQMRASPFVVPGLEVPRRPSCVARIDGSSLAGVDRLRSSCGLPADCAAGGHSNRARCLASARSTFTLTPVFTRRRRP